MNAQYAKSKLVSLAAGVMFATFMAGSAQACLPFMSGGPGGSGCAASQNAGPTACDRAGPAQGAGKSACLTESAGLISPELVSAVGDLAAGGMQIASHMMRALADEVGRYAAVSDAPGADAPGR